MSAGGTAVEIRALASPAGINEASKASRQIARSKFLDLILHTPHLIEAHF
jgi:hypothetical protein